MKSTEYSYGWPYRVVTLFFTLAFTGMITFAVIISLVNMIRWVIYGGPPNGIAGIIVPASMAIIGGTMTAAAANLKPNVRVSDKGLEVQKFLFWWHLIPWEDVKDIRSVPIIGRSRLRLVVVRKLTFFHRLIGTTYFAFFQPAFLIGSEIDNYDELVHLIKKKIGKELWE